MPRRLFEGYEPVTALIDRLFKNNLNEPSNFYDSCVKSGAYSKTLTGVFVDYYNWIYSKKLEHDEHVVQIIHELTNQICKFSPTMHLASNADLTLLHFAACYGDMSLVNHLLKTNQIDINARSYAYGGLTPLFLCVLQNKSRSFDDTLATVKLLIESGAELHLTLKNNLTFNDQSFKKGQNFLDICCQLKLSALVSFLINEKHMDPKASPEYVEFIKNAINEPGAYEGNYFSNPCVII